MRARRSTANFWVRRKRKCTRTLGDCDPVARGAMSPARGPMTAATSECSQSFSDCSRWISRCKLFGVEPPRRDWRRAEIVLN
jgi:hypothetical protein